jgi:hypothetical protein
MKKIITICLLVASVFVVNAQEKAIQNTNKETIKKPNKILPIFNEKSPILKSQTSNFVLNNSSSGNAKWKVSKTGVRVNIANFERSDYLILNVVKPYVNLEPNAFNKAILEIMHSIKLGDEVNAQIEVQLSTGSDWIKFEDLTKIFLEYTSGEIKKTPTQLLNYPANVFTNNVIYQDYSNRYSIHIAGINKAEDVTKLKIEDLPNITKLRFRLVKHNEKSKKEIRDFDDSFWEIRLVRAYLEVYKNKTNTQRQEYKKSKIKNESGVQEKSNTKNSSKYKMQRQVSNPSDNGGSNNYQDVDNYGFGGTCPLPHGH